MARLTKLDLLQYALEGVRTLIGCHPDPLSDIEYLDELERDRDLILKRIAAVERAQQLAKFP